MIFKCKMCGGNLEVPEGATVIECEYCGTKQTLPRLDDERKANLYDRANHFRRNNDYDKAMAIYEQILEEDTTDAESYWSIVLCKYGIEYVEDTKTKKRIPTINRMQLTSIFADEDYRSALKNADAVQKEIYQLEAKQIDELQKEILEISNKEDPFDVFICYKETDADGRRTKESVFANDIYHELTAEGLKVFFARITLEDKLGQAYEPYIFSALNSSKVMVVLGAKPENLNAVWVKNEWSRYLALIKNGEKKTLIPCYKDMDPYDLPEEFSHLQAQDMSKLGFMSDLIRGIKKICTPVKEEKQEVKSVGGGVNVASLLERAKVALEDGEFSSADSFCEKVLDIDAKNTTAYLYKLLADLKVNDYDDLIDLDESFEDNIYITKIERYDGELAKRLLDICVKIASRNLNDINEKIYCEAKSLLESAKITDDMQNTINYFDTTERADYGDDEDDDDDKKFVKQKEKLTIIANFIKDKYDTISQVMEQFESLFEYDYKDCKTLSQTCEKTLKNYDYILAIIASTSNTINELQNAIKGFHELSGYKNSDKLLIATKEKIKKLQAKLDRIELERIKKIYDEAIKIKDTETTSIGLQKAVDSLKNIIDYKDSKAIIEELQIKINELSKAEKEKLNAELKSKKIKNLTIIITIMLATVLFIVFVFVKPSCDKKIQSNGLKLEEVSSGYEVTGLENNDATTAVIPSVYLGKPVIGIGNSAFSGHRSLSSIIIPNSVTSIGEYAFYNCISLSSIEIPDSVTNIGNDSFKLCESLSNVEIGSGVTSIGNYAFYYCTSLSSIVIPNSVTSIGSSAFENCTSLSSIEIGDRVTIIGNSAFSSCTSLSSIEIGDSVTSIGGGAFSGCTSLSSIVIPNSVTSIGHDAFYNCTSLSSVEIGSGVTSIGWGAFNGCSSLSSVTFANTTGWKSGSTSISSSSLQNTSTAAKYLTSDYKDKNWTRS